MGFLRQSIRKIYNINALFLICGNLRNLRIRFGFFKAVYQEAMEKEFTYQVWFKVP